MGRGDAFFAWTDWRGTLDVGMVMGTVQTVCMEWAWA